MEFYGIEDGNHNTDGPFGVHEVGAAGDKRSGGEGRGVAAGKEHAGEVADGGYNDCKMITAIPKTVIRSLISEDLCRKSLEGCMETVQGLRECGRTSIRPTTIDKLGIYTSER